MDDKELLDLYSDYLISSFGQTSGMGVAQLLGGSVSHDRIQHLLSKQDFTVKFSNFAMGFLYPHSIDGLLL